MDMADALTVENVDVAKMLSVEGADKSVDDMVAAMEENPAVKKLMDAAETLEDMYHVVKEYLAIKLEDFKVLFDKTVDYFKETKAALSDDVLDNVVGGGFWDCVGKWRKEILAVTVLVGSVVECTLIGAAIGGPAGAACGAFVGLFVGAAGAAAVNDYM